jgi:excisionase family DNA binding protein
MSWKGVQLHRSPPATYLGGIGVILSRRTGPHLCLVTNETTPPTRREAAASTQLTPQEITQLEKLLNTVETAAALNISKRGLQEQVADRKIGYIKIGRNIRFHRDDIARFIESHRCQPVGWKSANREGSAR